MIYAYSCVQAETLSTEPENYLSGQVNRPWMADD